MLLTQLYGDQEDLIGSFYFHYHLERYVHVHVCVREGGGMEGDWEGGRERG